MPTTQKYVHFYHKAQPYTYLAFGPYESAKGNVYDIEVCEDHILPREEPRKWLFSATIDRDTHIVADMWKYMNAYSSGNHQAMLGCVIPSKKEDRDV
jgi:hypothetical protein